MLTRRLTLLIFPVALLTAMSVMPVAALEGDQSALPDPAEPQTSLQLDGHPEDDPEGEGHDHDIDSIGSGTLSPFFNESAGCEGPDGIRTPYSTTNSLPNRALPSGHQVRGPWGDFFGRSYGDVAGSMVEWEIPMSSGLSRLVHKRALPAFQAVSANLAAEEAKGNYYQIRKAGGFVWRRIGGSYRMSTHSFGMTMDINSDKNPYSGSNKLKTDMPDWFVEAWTDAGFCWGGHWQTVKDPMHFAWKGPTATQGYGTIPAPYPADTTGGGYLQNGFSGDVSFGTLDPAHTYLFADGNRDAAPDVFRIREWAEDDLKVDYTRSSVDFGWCGVSSAVIQGAGALPGQVVVGDVDGDARPDVMVVDDTGSKVAIRAHKYADNYAEVTTMATSASPHEGASYGFADYDRDGFGDLYRISRAGVTRVAVWSAASEFSDKILDVVTALPPTDDEKVWHLSLADKDRDGAPDVIAIKVTDVVTVNVVKGSGGYAGAVSSIVSGASADAAGFYGMGDYDGDGRPDLLALESDGHLEIYLGGSQSKDVTFWFQPPGSTCDDPDGGGSGTGDFVPWDFDGDRVADLAVGAPGEDIEGLVDAGAVNVLYGTETGPANGDDQFWDQNVNGVVGAADDHEQFGSTLASGDFDGDDLADLAIGVPGDVVSGHAAAGAVNVLYGTSSGLTAVDDQLWHQDVTGVAGAAEGEDRFGGALATGDFDDDGYDDLAIGAPGEGVGAGPDNGIVTILYGSAEGLTADRDKAFHQNTAGVPGNAARDDRFSASLAAGDVDGDGRDDLIIGAPGDDISGKEQAGLIVLLFGGPNGITSSGAEKWTQKSGIVGGTPEPFDHFGATVAAGDINGDGNADVAVGVPSEGRGGVEDVGQVHIFYGSASGLIAEKQVWHQGRSSVIGSKGEGDSVGEALAIGDFDDDGFGDLAFGVPHDRVAGVANVGSVGILFGTATGLTGAGDQSLQPGQDGRLGAAGAGDGYGSSLRAADLNGDGFSDLAVGIPFEDLGAADAGAVHVVFGSAEGLAAFGDQIWSQNSSGIADVGEKGDHLGKLD